MIDPFPRSPYTNLRVLFVQVVLLSRVVPQVVQLVAVGVSVGVKLALVHAVLAVAGPDADHLGVEKWIVLQHMERQDEAHLFSGAGMELASTQKRDAHNDEQGSLPMSCRFGLITRRSMHTPRFDAAFDEGNG